MRDGFCDWCVKCAKYLALGTFERADDSALSKNFPLNKFILISKKKFILPLYTTYLTLKHQYTEVTYILLTKTLNHLKYLLTHYKQKTLPTLIMIKHSPPTTQKKKNFSIAEFFFFFLGSKRDNIKRS